VPVRADWADFPEAAARGERRSTIMRPACNGPINWKDRTAVQKDAGNFKAALASVKPGRRLHDRRLAGGSSRTS
jgi:hypothetical protein